MNTGVFDASGSEQKFNDSSACQCNGSRKTPPGPLFETEAEQAQNVTTAFLILQNILGPVYTVNSIP